MIHTLHYLLSGSPGLRAADDMIERGLDDAYHDRPPQSEDPVYGFNYRSARLLSDAENGRIILACNPVFRDYALPPIGVIGFDRDTESETAVFIPIASVLQQLSEGVRLLDMEGECALHYITRIQ